LSFSTNIFTFFAVPNSPFHIYLFVFLTNCDTTTALPYIRRQPSKCTNKLCT
jgi:hypothetical protein